MRIRQAMNQPPTCCDQTTTVVDAARLMEEKGIGSLPVLGPDAQLAGIVTDRDLVCRALAAGKDPATTPVAECMSAPVVTIEPEADIADCEELMKQHRIRRVVVADEAGRCVGIVAQADLADRVPSGDVGEVVCSVVQGAPGYVGTQGPADDEREEP